MKSLLELLNYEFSAPALLTEALTHPSTGESPNYERLEFLGDSVIELIVTQMLLQKFPSETEGDLAKRRAALVNRESLAKLAKQLQLDTHIILSSGEEKSGGRENPANLENAFEALMGAVFLDENLEAVKSILLPLMDPEADTMITPPRDTKSLLQEWAQGLGHPIPDYSMIEMTGPAHAPEFVVEVVVERVGRALGTGLSKKAAEREAAANLLAQLG